MSTNPDSHSHTDKQLIDMFKSGDDSAFTELADRHLKLIHSITSKYSIAGLEPDDLTQEGMLGLLSAVNTYDESKGASFQTYAGICIKRRIISLLERSSTDKNKALSNYMSLDSDAFEYDPLSDGTDPEALIIAREELSSVYEAMASRLSRTEANTLKLYLAGKSYEEIAREMHSNTKSVDNAIQRVRRKLRGT